MLCDFGPVAYSLWPLDFPVGEMLWGLDILGFMASAL